MSVLHRTEREHTPLELPERLDGVYKVTEAFRSIAVAWESISAGAWSAAAIQSFAALARRVVLDLSTLGCGALDRAVVDLVLALDALTVAGTVSEPQLTRVDYALAGIRQVVMQRLISTDLADMATSGGQAPVLLHEACPRCQAYGACTIFRRFHQGREA